MAKHEKTVLAKNIVARRKELGIKTAQDLAELADIPYGTLRDIEAGYSEGRRSTREAIARALKCSVEELNAPIVPTQSRRISETTLKAAVSDAIKELFPSQLAMPASPRALSSDEEHLLALIRKVGPAFGKTIITIVEGAVRAHQKELGAAKRKKA